MHCGGNTLTLEHLVGILLVHRVSCIMRSPRNRRKTQLQRNTAAYRRKTQVQRNIAAIAAERTHNPLCIHGQLLPEEYYRRGTAQGYAFAGTCSLSTCPADGPFLQCTQMKSTCGGSRLFHGWVRVISRNFSPPPYIHAVKLFLSLPYGLKNTHTKSGEKVSPNEEVKPPPSFLKDLAAPTGV